MDLIYMNSSKEDLGILHDYDFDLAFGSGENDFECRIVSSLHCCEASYFLYVEGTEYGGIIDGIESDTTNDEVIYHGRTWHGILNSKIIEPDTGEAYLAVSGEANAVLGYLLGRMNMGSLFAASTEDSGLTINSYQMNRYIGGYDGIIKMLKTVNAKLLIKFQNGKVVLSAAPIQDYSQGGEVDSDLINFSVKQTVNKVNHLICLGQGELEERLVVHLYADRDGNISQTQTFFGVDEYTAVYDYSSVESEDELLSSGRDKLKELRQQDDIDADINEADDSYDVGDLVGATEHITGIRITVSVTKKIVTIKDGVVAVNIRTDVASSGSSATSGGTASGGSSGGGGTDDHTQLINRDVDNQHPMSAITDLDSTLTTKLDAANALSNTQIENLLGGI